MPGANNGTGQPMTFACSKCRKKWPLDDRDYGSLPGLKFEATGKVRHNANGRGGSRVCHTRYQYRCLTCGHVGWSRHTDMAWQADRQGVAPHPEDKQSVARFEKHQKEKA